MEFEKKHIAAEVANLTDANSFVESCADRFRLAEVKRFNVLLALEEAFVNICNYAYPENNGQVEIACGNDGLTFVLEIADSGSPFDVLSLPDPDITLDLMDRPIGGLGIHFIRTLTTSVGYRRENGRNILRMAFES